MNSWLCKFILEVRRKDGNEYPPNTLYAIACGVQRHVRKYAGTRKVNYFMNPEFSRVLDGEMKRIGLGSNIKRAEPISRHEEEILWEKGILGKSSPQMLLDTMVYMCGVFFALRSGQEHRDLQFGQFKLTEKEGHKFIVYTENVSKNRPGGIKQRKVESKIVEHHQNLAIPERCFISIYEFYLRHCRLTGRLRHFISLH